MAKIRRCPKCKVTFPTINAVNDHYKLTSHTPLPYKCESKSCERVYRKFTTLQVHIQSKHPHLPIFYECGCCKGVFQMLSTLLSHFQSEHPHLPLPSSCKSCQRVFETSSGLQQHYKSKRHHLQESITRKRDASNVVTPIDGSTLDTRRDDDDSDSDVDGTGSPDSISNCDAQGDLTLAKNIQRPSTVLSGNISKPLSPISEPTLSAPSSTAGPSLLKSKSDEATALARAALRSRFAELGVSNSTDVSPLSKYDIWGSKKDNLSASNVDGPCSITTDLSLNSRNSDVSKLALQPLDNKTRTDRFICPGCRIDFKSFSGFVLHIENRLCKSSMYHEIEDQINACATQLFDNLACGGR